jgi:hypothetical protein
MPGLQALGVRIRQQREIQGLSPSRSGCWISSRRALEPGVSDSLLMSAATVRKHLEHAYAKLGVGNRNAAAARAFPRHSS